MNYLMKTFTHWQRCAALADWHNTELAPGPTPAIYSSLPPQILLLLWKPRLLTPRQAPPPSRICVWVSLSFSLSFFLSRSFFFSAFVSECVRE